MAAPKGFAEMVLEQRAIDREKLSAALGAERGPQPYAKQASEPEQDQMWLQTHPDYTDPPEVTDAFSRSFASYRAQNLPPEQAASHAALETLAMYPMSKYLQLLAPPEQGGQGLTPLAASYEKYPYRRFLVEGAGPDIASQIKYAQRRHQRTQGASPRQDISPPPPQPLGQPAQDVALAGPPPMPTPPPTPPAAVSPIQTGPQSLPPGLPVAPPTGGPGGY